MKIIKYITILTLLLSFSSCSDWLDIQPKSQVTDETMFSRPDGFQAALAGIYINMSSENLYGRNLTVYVMELLAQNIRDNYTQAVGASFYHHSELQYYYIHLDNRSARNEATFSDMWSKAYNTVANINYFINQLEVKDDIFFEALSIGNGAKVKSVLLGEAYALRAYIHYDMMRLFQLPLWAEGGRTSKRVPYVDKYALDLTPSMTTDEILVKVLADVEKAESLLKDSDPTVTGENFGYAYLDANRNRRMNYFAVRAFKARALLMKEDYSAAYDEAKYVIDNVSKISARFATEEDMAAKDIAQTNATAINRSFPMENVFGLHVEKLASYTSNFAWGAPQVSALRCAQFSSSIIVSNYNAADIRRKYWFNSNISNSRGQFEKYTRSTEQSINERYPEPCIALLKLGEMYLIASEAAAKATDKGGLGEAYRILNNFKTLRSTPTIVEGDAAQFATDIDKENFCELYGDGQVYFFYKRTNRKVIKHAFGAGTMPVQMNMTPEWYTPDLPQAEISGGRTY